MASIKLTLSVNPQVIEAAKRYAADHGTSVSELVENFLAAVVAAPQDRPSTPVLDRLRGSLREGDPKEYYRYLAQKYA